MGVIVRAWRCVMKFTKDVPYTILGAFGVLIATSAYVVYGNTLKSLPMGASYFWFSFFAFFGSLLFPQIDEGIRKRSFRALYPEMPGKQWLRSVKQIKIWKIAANGGL